MILKPKYLQTEYLTDNLSCNDFIAKYKKHINLLDKDILSEFKWDAKTEKRNIKLDTMHKILFDGVFQCLLNEFTPVIEEELFNNFTLFIKQELRRYKALSDLDIDKIVDNMDTIITLLDENGDEIIETFNINSNELRLLIEIYHEELSWVELNLIFEETKRVLINEI